METERPRKPLILVVDDTPANLHVLASALRADYRIKTATHGQAALDIAAREDRPDLILLDVMMPNMSGFEVCRRLRADPTTRGVAVLMVTALDQANDVEAAVEAGTDDFLTKPINKTELLLRVRALLESRAKPTDLERALAYIERVQAGL